VGQTLKTFLVGGNTGGVGFLSKAKKGVQERTGKKGVRLPWGGKHVYCKSTFGFEGSFWGPNQRKLVKK